MDRKSLSKHNLAVSKHKAYGVFRAALPVFPQLFATTHHSFVTSTRLLKKLLFLPQTTQWLLGYKCLNYLLCDFCTIKSWYDLTSSN